MVEARINHKRYCYGDRRLYFCSRRLTGKDFAALARRHWQIENARHWTFDITFQEDLSRLKKGHGAENLTIVRHFVLRIGIIKRIGIINAFFPLGRAQS